jgi:hypothetical protein
MLFKVLRSKPMLNEEKNESAQRPFRSFERRPEFNAASAPGSSHGA